MAGGEIACFAAIFYLDTMEFFVKPGGSGSGNIFAIYQFIFPYSVHRSPSRDPWLKNKLPGTTLSY
jgi:hypothetical protein